MKAAAIFERAALLRLKPLGARGEWLELGGERIHQISLPPERPRAGPSSPLILVHGLGSNAGSYGPLMRRASPYFKRLAAPSAPGQGLSPPPRSAYDSEGVYMIWRALLDQHSAREPCFVLGTSLGGAIALRYAIERPERVRGLILCSPAGAQMSAEEIEEIRGRFNMSKLSDGQRFLRLLFDQPPPLSYLLGLAVRSTLGGDEVQGFLRSLTPQLGLSSAQLAQLRSPTLLFWGQRERILPRGILKRYQASIPPELLTLREPARFSHSPQLESVDELISELLAWLPGLESPLTADSTAR